MLDELILRDKAREAMRAGKLPSRRPERTWGGPGVGASCAICSEVIKRHHLELELQFKQDGSAGLTVYHLHIRCFTAWEFERTHGDAHG